MHSVKSAAHLTGLPPDTLRAWEKRYGVVQPKRDAQGHRVYNAADVAKLSLLNRAVTLGHSIGRAARLSLPELQDLVTGARQDELDRLAPGLVQRALTAIEDYRPDACDEVLGIALATLAPVDVIRHVLSPLINQVGERWHRGELSVAQEHLLSASVERLLMVVIHTHLRAARGPVIIFGTPSGERHALGSLEAAFLAASRGLRAFYLGPDLPAQELADAAARLGAAVLALSLVTIDALDDRLDQIRQLAALLPHTIDLWLGGIATEHLSADSLPIRCTILHGIDDYLHRLDILQSSNRIGRTP